MSGEQKAYSGPKDTYIKPVWLMDIDEVGALDIAAECPQCGMPNNTTKEFVYDSHTNKLLYRKYRCCRCEKQFTKEHPNNEGGEK